MQLRFAKMHGLGNDFVVVDRITQKVDLSATQIRRLADRKRGIGFDQLLIVDVPENPSADFRYQIFNADGSEVGQCGNGARCFARYVRRRKLTGKDSILVETASGMLRMGLLKGDLVRVDMGPPILEPAQVPFVAAHRATSYRLQTETDTVSVSVLSMGNPHAVMLCQDIDTAPVAALGPEIEGHERFPERVNVGFMQVLDRGHVRLRVFERGVGETSACGSGACAAVVAGRLLRLLDESVEVELPGGKLTIEWEGGEHPVFMTGSATYVFEGKLEL